MRGVSWYSVNESVAALRVRSSQSHKKVPAAATVSGAATRHQHAFDLPQESLDVTPARAATAGQLRGLTMLVVEDDSDARYIFRRMLTLEGALVLEAPEGVAALALCRSNARIDVILSDLLMPSLDGFGFVRGFDTGFSRHLTKPIDIETLMPTILSVTPPKTLP